MSRSGCSHTSWLQIVGDAKTGFSLRCDDRYDQVVNGLAAASKQNPSLALFLGNKYRDLALKHLFPSNFNRRSRAEPATVNLRVTRDPQPTTILSCSPIVIRYNLSGH